MPNKDGHRRFGNVRKLPSGRYQARYPGPDGILRNAPETFARKGDADRWLTLLEAKMVRGDWVDPARAAVKLQTYAEQWIEHRTLRPRTVDLYRWILGKHITPYLGGVPLAKLDTALIREWRSTLLKNGVSQSGTAKAYRLLRAILGTAVDEDQIIPRNPCRIRGAQDEGTAERPVLTVDQVFRLAEKMADQRFRAFVLVATFGSLRWGELTALRREDVDLDAGTIRVRFAYVERSTGELVLGPPKSRAGRRTVTLPAPVVAILREHMGEYSADGTDGLVFPGAKGAVLRRSNFNKATGWMAAVKSIGATGLHLHDLRHTGNTLAAATGASLRDLMARMGHDSVRAAMIYQHATNQADREIAKVLGQQLAGRASEDETTDEDDPDDGASGVLAPTG